MAVWDTWVRDWQRTCDCVVNRGGTLKKFQVDPPAPLSRIKEVEERIGFPIPSSFREVLLNFSQRVDVIARSPDNASCSGPLQDVFAVSVMWDIESLPIFESERKELIDGTKDDTLFDPWRNVLIVEKSSGGDDIAINLQTLTKEEIVLLSLKHDETHGCKLGADFQVFVDQMTDIGIPLWDSYGIRPFLDKKGRYLDPECGNAKAWREWLGYSRM